MEPAGQLTYGCCILVANWVILHKFHIHDGYNILTIILMILSYFIAGAVEGKIMKINELIGVQDMLFTTGITCWQIYLLACAITSSFEVAFTNLMKLNVDDDLYEEIDQSSESGQRLNGASMKSINLTHSSEDEQSEVTNSYQK